MLNGCKQCVRTGGFVYVEVKTLQEIIRFQFSHIHIATFQQHLHMKYKALS
jgi:hypothetical protein